MDDRSEDNAVSTLGWPDYLVIGIMLTISSGIGVYYRFTGGRQRTTEEYFQANRSMGMLPLSIALAVSFISTITMFGISAENYVHGTQIAVMYLSGFIGTPITIFFYLPVFYKLQITSVYEYLEKRFGVKIRMVASVANFLHLILYSGVVLFAPSLALEQTTNLSGNTSIVLIGIICIFYSTVGGIKAVLITDVFQGVLMIVGIICVLCIAAANMDDGLASVWSIAKDGGRIGFFDFRLDPTIRHTWWCVLIGGTTLFLSLYAVNQVQVQRLLTAKSLKSSANALMLSGPYSICMGGLTSFAGLALYALYKDCDPVTSGKISSFDQIMPFFAADLMSKTPGIVGLFISGVFSACLSTISAMLNSLAAIEIEDYVKPVCRKFHIEFPDEKATFIGKILAIANGFACLALAFLAKTLDSLVEATVGIIGAIGGPILGIFSLGMFTESANEAGAIVGAITATMTCLFCIFGARPATANLPLSVEGCDNSTLLNFQNVTQIHDDGVHASYFYLNRISYMWYNPMGFAITFLVGYLVSLATNRILYKDAPEPDPNLFTPLLAARIRRRREDVERTTSSQVFVLQHRK